MQTTVNNASYTEFKGRYYSAPYDTAKKKALIFQIHIDDMNQHKSKTAGQNHRPVCITAGYNLNKAVNYSSESKDCQVFS